MNPPHGIDECRTLYGDVKIERSAQGGWRITSPVAWEVACMVLLRDLPGLAGRKLYVHRAIVAPLRAALAQWQATCPEYSIRTMGCFNPRPKRTRTGPAQVVGWDQGLSLHAVGAAVDFNADANPMRSPMVSDMPDAFVRAFTDNGWTWGGDFPTPDPMHVQFATGI